MRRYLVLLAAAFTMSGCLTMGVYRTAHVMPEGEGDFGLNFSVVRATIDEPSGTSIGKTSFTYPNLIPEIAYHYGMSENTEVGGRIALGAGMIELDVKYRLLHSDALDLAVIPAAGYQALFFIEGFHGSLPVVLTYDLKPRVSLNVSAFGNYTHYSFTESSTSDNLDLSGDTINAGGAIGVEFRSRGGFHFMPGIEVQRSVHRSGDFIGEIPNITSVIFGVMMGWGPNERLRKMDRQMDRIEQKLDRTLAPQTGGDAPPTGEGAPERQPE